MVRDAPHDGLLVVHVDRAGTLTGLVEHSDVIFESLRDAVGRYADIADIAQPDCARSLDDEHGPLDRLDIRRRDSALEAERHDLLADIQGEIAIRRPRERRVL